MKGILKKIVYGPLPVSEYATVTTSGIKEEVSLSAGRVKVDISRSQWLLCLDPVVFGIWITDKTIITVLEENKNALISFSVPRKKAAAIVEAALMESIATNEGKLLLFKAVTSKLYHTNPLSFILLYRKYYKKPQWPVERYRSLIAAYSYPRQVRLVSFREEGYLNIFPMDLLGPVPQSNLFVFGLRHTNTALSRLIAGKKITVSEIAPDHKDIIYHLGKHHSSGPPSPGALPFAVMQTEQFGFYIPEWVESYKEIEIISTIDLGSHMLLWGKVVHEKQLAAGTKRLFHIHFLEALYLYKNGISYQPV